MYVRVPGEGLRGLNPNPASVKCIRELDQLLTPGVEQESYDEVSMQSIHQAQLSPFLLGIVFSTVQYTCASKYIKMANRNDDEPTSAAP